MQVDYNSWHSRLYRIWFGLKYYGREPELGYYTNLCPYMRAVLFFWWSRFLFINGKIGRLPVAAVSYPLTVILIPVMAGGVSHGLMKSVLALYIALASIFAAVAGIIGIIYLFQQGTKRAKSASFVKLTASYAHSVHSKICPTIELVRTEK